MSYKVRYTLRKSRKFGTLMPVMFGVILGGIILSSNTTHASEAIVNTTENPATNATEAQPTEIPEAIESHHKAHQSEGELNVSPSQIALDATINEAQNQGLSTELTTTINQGITSNIKETEKKQLQISTDYQEQIKDIKNTVTQYQQQKQAYQQKQVQISLDNANKKEQYLQKMQQHHETVKKINDINQKQQQAYQEALANYHHEVKNIDAFNKNQEKQYQAAYQTYNQHKNQITKFNQQQQEAYNQAMLQYNQQLATYQQKQQQYDEAMQHYNNAVKEINQKNNNLLFQYNQKIKELNQKQIEIDRQNQQALIKYQQKVNKTKQVVSDGMNNPTTTIASDGDNTQYSASQSWTNLKSKTIDHDIHIVASGKVNNVEDLQNGNYAVYVYSDTAGKITNDNIIQSIHWGDVDIIGNVVEGDKITESYQQITGLNNSLYDVTTGNTSKVFSVKSGEWFKIPQAVSLANHQKKDLLVKLTKSGTPLTYGEDWITVWNANGAINYYDGSHVLTEEAPADKISATYKIADTQDKYLWTAATFDIDGGQYMTLNTEDSAIVSIGGGLKLENKNVYADEQLGYTWGKNTNANALDGTNSTPDGVMVFTEFSNEISHTLSNTPGGNSTSVANADFGISVNISVAEYPILQHKILLPPKPQLHELPNKPTNSIKINQPPRPQKLPDKPIPMVPQKPKIKTYPKKPTLPINKKIPLPPIEPIYQRLPDQPQPSKIKYHYQKLAMRPNIEKQVTNYQNLNISNALVPKLSEVYWHLTTENLPSSREKINRYIFTDYLPSGFSLDLLATQKNNQNFKLDFNPQKNILQLQATPKYLKYINQNLSKELSVVSPVIIGRVLNDGAIYTNNFKQQINNYVSYSNNVQVATPGNPKDPQHPHNNLIRPIKYNTNQEGIIINDKEVLAGSTNYYQLTWDLDQYKDIKATDKAINKGFYFIDDYPENILTPDLSKIKINNNIIQEMTDIDVNIYSNMDKVPSQLQQILKLANIQPKGAFQLFSANNPKLFYDKYVKKGESLTIITPMIINHDLAQRGGEFSNRAYQIDFGNGYATNIVKNHIPIMRPHKDVVVNINDQTSLEGKKISLNELFNYHLIGADLPNNRAEPIIEYSFIDHYDNKRDKYTEEYHVFATKDLVLTNGSLITKGTEVTHHTVQNHEDNKIIISFNKEFLLNIDKNSTVQFDMYLKMKRINPGTIENKFINRINGVNVISNTVHTHTTMKNKFKPMKLHSHMLPKTGQTTLPTTFLGLLLLVLSIFKIKKYN